MRPPDWGRFCFVIVIVNFIFFTPDIKPQPTRPVKNYLLNSGKGRNREAQQRRLNISIQSGAQQTDAMIELL
jgi:hypothetical protein